MAKILFFAFLIYFHERFILERLHSTFKINFRNFPNLLQTFNPENRNTENIQTTVSRTSLPTTTQIKAELFKLVFS